MNVCIFEDSGFSDCYPLTYTRPVFELTCGVLSLREKIRRRIAHEEVILACRKYLQPVLEAANPDKRVNRIPRHDTMFINGRVLFHDASGVPEASDGAVCWVQDETLLAAYVPADFISAVATSSPNELLSFDNVPFTQRHQVDWPVLRYPWEYVVAMPAEIPHDVRLLGWSRTVHPDDHPGAYIAGPENVYTAPGVSIKPGAVLDGEAGVIALGEGAVIGHNATVIGPCSIGPSTKISPGAKITGKCAFGPVCKVGGEVGETIFLGYSNKKHDGFLGGSYVGAWVNLGANTNNSDLKNNYSPVRVPINGHPVDTGLQFSGCVLGDHTKTGIGTTINTGSVFGVGCNVFGAGFPPKFIPSFIWGGPEQAEPYRLDKMLATARVVQSRRAVEMSAGYAQLLGEIYEMTREERTQFLENL